MVHFLLRSTWTTTPCTDTIRVIWISDNILLISLWQESTDSAHLLQDLELDSTVEWKRPYVHVCTLWGVNSICAICPGGDANKDLLETCHWISKTIAATQSCENLLLGHAQVSEFIYARSAKYHIDEKHNK
jgi:hypothetical protein